MKQKIYNITICILCVVSVTFAIIDFTKGLIGSLTSSITSFFLHTDKGPKKFSSDKVEMVLTMYESLSDDEKQAVKQELQEPTKNR